MALPPVQIPTLRAILGAVALDKTTSRTTNRELYKLQGGLTVNDVAVREVVNDAIDSLDAGAGESAIEFEATSTDDIVLTEDQAKARVITVYGDPGGDVELILPFGSQGLWVVRNDTDDTANILVSVAPDPDPPEPVIITPVTVAVGDERLIYVGTYGNAREPSNTFDPAAPGPIGAGVPDDGTFLQLTADSISLLGAGTYASRPAVSGGGQRFACTDSPVGDWVCVSGVWRPIVDGVVGVEVPPTGWTWVNQGAATVDTSKGAIHLAAPSTAPTQLRAYVRTAPATPWTVTACVSLLPTLSTTSGAFAVGGLVYRESGTGEMITFVVTWVYDATASYYTITSGKLNSATSFSAPYFAHRIAAPGRVWLRIADNGTNRISSWSNDGKNFAALHTVSRTDWLTADQYGIAAEGASMNGAVTVLSLDES